MLNVNGVVIRLAGGGDTSTLHYVINVDSTFCGNTKTYTALAPLAPALTPSYLLNLHTHCALALMTP